MVTVRYLTMALLVCSVLLCGCDCCETETEQTDDTAEASQETVAAEEPEAPAGGDMSPPSPGASFKAKRLADALRGLSYDSGREVAVVEPADPLFGVETFESAGEAYQRGLYYL